MLPYEKLEQRIGHNFADPFLLQTALTHRSFGAPHNERLEFLGDGVLNCVIAALLYRRFDQLPEGDLSRLRANLVRQDSLHRIALELELGSRLQLGDGERKSGGHSRPSILADSLEAIFGAVFQDAGFDVTREVIDRLYAPLLNEIDLTKTIKDAKTRLQEWLQGHRHELPLYQLQGAEGGTHAQEFLIECRINALNVVTEGRGPSRRIAEQKAAALALEQIEHMTVVPTRKKNRPGSPERTSS